jgi:hypothetical protein
MTDHLKSILNSELSMLPYKFFDLEEAHKLKGEIESRFEIDVRELFSSQSKLDKLKAKLGKQKFRALCALYFAQFSSSDGFNIEALAKELERHKTVMERHLGKEWIYVIQLFSKLHKEIKPKPKAEEPQGLLRRVI